MFCVDAGEGPTVANLTECAGCTEPSQCDGTDTPCNVRTCEAGVCGRTFVVRGSICSDAGDTCDGIGWCGLVPDGGFPYP